MNPMDNVLAMILGGGAGTRLYPLTLQRSKPAVPVAGKYRLIDIPISNCLNSGLSRMYVLTQFNSRSLNRHVKQAYHFDIFSKGFVDILAAEQTRDNMGWFQGTADAVRQSLDHLKNHEFEHIIILSGDQLYQMDFSEILESHIAQNAQITIATIPVNASDATGFGIMKVNEDSEIESFVEKPTTDILDDWTSPVDRRHKAEGKDYLASMGIYLFNKETLFELLDSMPDAIDFGKEIIPHAVQDENCKILSYAYGGYWTDIGSIKSYFEANLYLTEYLPEFNFYDNYNQVFTNARMLAPSKIFGTTITHALISDGCIIHADSIEKSVIGIRSRIGPKAQIKNAIIMGNDYYQSLKQMASHPGVKILGIGDNCKIMNAIIDKNVKVGNNVSIVGHKGLKDVETDLYCVKDGIIIVKKGVEIPNDTSIGV